MFVDKVEPMKLHVVTAGGHVYIPLENSQSLFSSTEVFSRECIPKVHN